MAGMTDRPGRRSARAWLGSRWSGRAAGGWRTARRLWRDYQWFVLGALSLVAAGLGYVGFRKLAVAAGEPASPANLVYLALQLFMLDSGAVTGPIGWELEVARWLAPAVAAYAAVQALAALFAEQIQSARLRFLRDHFVICGASRKGVLLATGFRRQGDRVVVVESDEDSDLLDACRAQGASVVLGDASDVQVLRKAGVHRARCVIAVCGDDAINAEIAMGARRLAARHRLRPLKCIIHLVDPRLCDLLKERELELEAGSGFRLELFNVYERGARLLVGETALLAGPDLERPPHLLIVGLGWLGSSLAVQAAKAWRDRTGPPGGRLRISVVDRSADWKCEALALRYPQLSAVCDLIPYQMDIHSAEFERGEFLAADGGACDVDGVYVCIDDDAFSLHVGLSLLGRTRQCAIPVVVRMAADAGLAALLHGSGSGDGGFRNLHAFGLLDRTCTPELVVGGTHEILARAMHDDYRRQQEAVGETPKSRPFLVPWDDLPEWKKESNRRVVDHIAARLRAVGCGISPLTDWEAGSFAFDAEEVEALARLEHERWWDELLGQGWRHAAGDRDDGAKTHPWLVPWADLPKEVRSDNRDRVGRLPAFLAQAGFQVHRRQ